MGRGRVCRVDKRCENAIRDIQEKIDKNLDLKVSFAEASRYLGEKYWRGHLNIIPYSEIEKEQKHKSGGRRYL